VTQKDAGRELVLFAWTQLTWAAKPRVGLSRHPAQFFRSEPIPSLTPWSAP